MADRSVVVTLGAVVAPYVAGMAKVSAATAATARNIQTQLGAAGAQTAKLGTAAGVVPGRFAAMGTAAGVAGVAVAGGIALAVKQFADFDVAMSAVEASTGATGAELESLRDVAVDAGSKTKFGATEAARGIESLGKAGVSTADIVRGGLAGALDLAAAGEIEVADAAEVAATALTQFGLAGRDVPHVADLLAAAAGKAQGGVSDMGMALKQSGLVASQMGLSIEETTGTLAAFASAGLLGSDAGTSFRTMLLRLANPSGEAATLMDELGIAAYDAQGNFVGMGALAGQLQDRLAGLSQEQRDAALATIFGSDAIRAANVLYGQGARGIAEWTGKVDDAGFAADQAATRTDNLRGDLERLGGTLESVAIEKGGAFNDFLRGMVQEVDHMVQSTDQALTEEAEIWRRNAAVWDLAGGNIGAAEEVFGNFTAKIAAAHDPMRTAEADTARLTAAAEAYAGRTGEATGAIAAETEMLAQLQQQAIDTANTFLGLSNATIGYEQAIDDASAALEANGATLDLNTQEGRDNQSALNGIASSALAVMQQMYDTGASEEDVAAKSASMRAALVAAGTRFGMTAAQANAYADEILAIPAKRNTTITITDQATAALRNIRAWLDGIRSKTVTITARTQIPAGVSVRQLMEQREGGYIAGFAQGGYYAGAYPAGGMVYGVGGPRSDSNMIRVSRGEFVVNAAATAANRGLLEAINSGRGGTAGGEVIGAVVDERALARAVGRAVNGATLILDDRGRGRLIAHEADLYSRAG